ncbi:MAG: hypothetical protein FRX49_11649 [Trebouxia sp. A1-2]|nr:MAG: hypothetical protein FRX49_11649 [Trebouxia sp. A1-2]
MGVGSAAGGMIWDGGRVLHQLRGHRPGARADHRTAQAATKVTEAVTLGGLPAERLSAAAVVYSSDHGLP